MQKKNREKNRNKNKNRQRKNRYYFAAILLLMASIIIFLFTAFLLNKLLVLEEKEIYATLIVSDTTGFDLNNTALTFGSIIPGASGSRNLLIANNYGFPIILEIKAIGNISRFLSFEKYVYVNADETKSISFIANVLAGEKHGKYSGKIIVVIKKGI